MEGVEGIVRLVVVDPDGSEGMNRYLRFRASASPNSLHRSFGVCSVCKSRK